MSKNPQHDRVKPRGGWGGSRAVYTMCKKTSDLVENGFPLILRNGRMCKPLLGNAEKALNWKDLQKLILTVS